MLMLSSFARREPSTNLRLPQNTFKDPETQYILCINCQEHINEDFIENHSQSCTVVSARLREMEAETSLAFTNFKLTKLANLLSLLLKEPSRSSGDRNYIKIFLSIAQRAILVTSVEDEAGNREVTESLCSTAATFSGTEALLLYSERLRMLLYEQTKVLRKEMMGGRLLDQMSEARTSKSGSQRGLIVVNSEVSSNSQGLSFISKSSSFSLNSIAEPMKALKLNSSKEFGDDSNDDELKRAFYSKCLSAKVRIPRRDPASRVSVLKLYKLMLAQQVPEEDWDTFLQIQFSNEANLPSRSLRQKRASSRSTSRDKNYYKPLMDSAVPPSIIRAIERME
jgi:hypothetical protein